MDAVIQAVTDAGYVAVNQRSFTAEDRLPTEVCERHVCSADLYLGLLGHRYGSRLPDRDISYTEFEYECAGASRIPRLIFLLSRQAPVPYSFVDQDDTRRQDEFRARARGTVTAEFQDAADLKYKVVRALTVQEAARRRAAEPVPLDALRRSLCELGPEVAWCAGYLAELVLGETAEIPVLLDGRVVLVDAEVAGGLVPELELPAVLAAWSRLCRALLTGVPDDLPALVAENAVSFRAVSRYLAGQQQHDPSARDRIGLRERAAESTVSTVYDRPQVRALIMRLWRDEEWEELEWQAARFTDAKDPVLRRGSRDALVAAIEAGAPAQAPRAALAAAGFADAFDAERADLLRAAKYAVIADDLAVAGRYVLAALKRWPDDPDVRMFAARLGL